MIVCTSCGYDNEDVETFCASCGGFLEWTGERLGATTAAPVSVDLEPAEEPAPVLVSAAPTPAAAPPLPPPPSPAYLPPAPPPEAPATGETDPGADAGQRLRELLERLGGGPAEQPVVEPTSTESFPVGQPVVEPTSTESAPIESAPIELPEPAPASGLDALFGEETSPSATTTSDVLAAPAAGAPAVDPVRQAALEHEARERVTREQEAEEARQRAAAMLSKPKPKPAALPPTDARPRTVVPTRREQPPSGDVPEPRGSEEDVAAESSTAPANGTNTAHAPTEARTPTDERVRRRLVPKAPVDDEVAPGDLVCGQCGAGNLATRKFCKRCGSSLEDARPVGRPSWWRRAARALKPHRRRKRVKVAGERSRASSPGKRGTAVSVSGAKDKMRFAKKLLSGVLGLALLALVLGPFRPTVWGWVDSLKSKFNSATHLTFTPVHPVSAVATPAVAGHGSALAIDGLSNTYWATAAKNNGVGQTLTVHFGSPTKLSKIGFLSGAQDDPKHFVQQSRIKMLTIRLSDGKTRTITLQDTANFQTFLLSGSNVTKLRLTIDSVYPGTKLGRTALSELELFQLT